jgi:hypothetical protein
MAAERGGCHAFNFDMYEEQLLLAPKISEIDLCK